MLVRRNSLVPMIGTPRGLDRVFDDLFADVPFGSTRSFEGRFPAVNTSEDEKGYTVEAELPGLKREDIEISVLGNELRIAGGAETKKDEENVTYHRRERFTGRFARVLRFPVDIDGEKVQAGYEAGILTIHLPKAAAALPRRIEVKS
jgi:HSP20 family protein